MACRGVGSAISHLREFLLFFVVSRFYLRVQVLVSTWAMDDTQTCENVSREQAVNWFVAL